VLCLCEPCSRWSFPYSSSHASIFWVTKYKAITHHSFRHASSLIHQYQHSETFCVILTATDPVFIMAHRNYTSGGEKASPGSGSSPAEPYEVGESYASPKSRFHISLAVDQEPSSFARTPAASNADFDPIPPSKRTWGTTAYAAYWMADGWAVSNWQVGESRVQMANRDLSITSLTAPSSVIYDCDRPELENGHWCSRAGKRCHGNGDHNQR
jgi:hypothetical protein